jgi:hypothetical protein
MYPLLLLSWPDGDDDLLRDAYHALGRVSGCLYSPEG